MDYNIHNYSFFSVSSTENSNSWTLDDSFVSTEGLCNLSWSPLCWAGFLKRTRIDKPHTLKEGLSHFYWPMWAECCLVCCNLKPHCEIPLNPTQNPPPTASHNSLGFTSFAVWKRPLSLKMKHIYICLWCFIVTGCKYTFNDTGQVFKITEHVCLLTFTCPPCTSSSCPRYQNISGPMTAQPRTDFQV